MRISLKPLGSPDAEALEWLQEDLSTLGTVALLPPAAVPPAARRSTGQIEAHRLLDALRGEAGERVLGVTEEDLTAGSMNFVLGMARILGRESVLSLHRLRSEDRARYRERVRKEAVHELGHTLGLEHCDVTGCVMNFSNSVEESDRKSHEFCARCSATVAFTRKRLGR